MIAIPIQDFQADPAPSAQRRTKRQGCLYCAGTQLKRCPYCDSGAKLVSNKEKPVHIDVYC
jgi:hypothetical protein